MQGYSSIKRVSSPNSKLEQQRNAQNNGLLPTPNKQESARMKSNEKALNPEKEERLPQRHEKSSSGLYSKFSQPKFFTEAHQVGYSASQIKQAVAFIFKKYDSNCDGFLTRDQVKTLIQKSLKHLGSTHSPSQLQIIEFIHSMDKNNDGKLSLQELTNAFKRANRIDY